ncbi:MAG: DUF2769 domain-containing protein [Candidatus Moranbacteria bacterium]|nr:DUF2769 domain-containing protein [Candidatus Moranbacteria bacterium]
MPKVPDTQENFEKCVCDRCPTWTAAPCPKEKTEKLYCAKGMTACGLKEKGCICGACPVHDENHLTGMYFCIKGAAK